MGCNECDKFEEMGRIYYYRWGVANIGIIACEKHAKEIFDVLNKVQIDGETKLSRGEEE